MREIRQSGSEGGEAELNRPSLPLSHSLRKHGGFSAACSAPEGVAFLTAWTELGRRVTGTRVISANI